LAALSLEAKAAKPASRTEAAAKDGAAAMRPDAKAETVREVKLGAMPASRAPPTRPARARAFTALER
jgi:hypothetical protein